MKRLRNLMLCLAFLIFATGCQNKELIAPSKVTEDFLKAYRTHDNTGIKTYSTWTTFNASQYLITEADYLPSVEEALQKEVYEKMLAFQYEIEKEEIKEEEAHVVVKITMYDFSKQIEAGIKKATEKTEALSKQSNISDEEIQKQIYTVLFESLNTAKQDKSTTVTINLVKKDGVWLVSDENEAMQTILTSNLTAIANMEP